MLETLSLIDRDYFQQFGWKQASLWALEEPDSLHSTFEATVSKFLSEISTDNSSRLQVIATTHSDLVLQYADLTVFVSKQDNETTFSGDESKREVLERAASTGISRWVHPILANPLEPVVLVEGKSDFLFLQQALRLLEPNLNSIVSYLGELQGGNITGGWTEMLSYVKTNIGAIRTRLPAAPLVIVLDWDSASRKTEFQKQIGDTDRAKVLVWPENTLIHISAELPVALSVISRIELSMRRVKGLSAQKLTERRRSQETSWVRSNKGFWQFFSVDRL